MKIQAAVTPHATSRTGADPSGYAPAVLGHEGAGVAGKGETLDIVPRYLITGRRTGSKA